MKKDNSSILVIILFVLIIVFVLFVPKIYSIIENSKLPKLQNSSIKQKEEIKRIDDELLSSLHYPIMRNSIYSKDTYYSLDTFKVSNMSNEDILYNAFLDMYEGNIVDSNIWGSCVTAPKEFSSEYIKLRVNNILGKDLKYTFADFKVPEDSTSNYKGTWKYDSSNSRFIYNANCRKTSYTSKYYNLEELIKAEYNNDDIVVYKYVGFAKVDNDNYVIYKDANMTEEISNGTFTSIEDLNNTFKSIDEKNKKIYKYTFKDTLCSYNEYCLYEGKWVNEL